MMSGRSMLNLDFGWTAVEDSSGSSLRRSLSGETVAPRTVAEEGVQTESESARHSDEIEDLGATYLWDSAQ